MKMLKLVLCFLLFFATAHAGDIDPSGFSLYSGGHFYVLTDGVFSTKENIQVRFEAGGNKDLKQYGGVDVRLYKIEKPLDFLKAQKNLHRPDVKANYYGEGLTNVLSYIWDVWYKKARLAWQRVFSSEIRKTAVSKVPTLVQPPAHTYKTIFKNENQFLPVAGLELIDTFRYPVWEAKLNVPPKDVALEGSSSNFITTSAGNVILPMGKRKPGLYLVEAMIGTYRATTLVFVSDSIVVTKVSSNQAFIWTVNKESGLSHGKSKVVLTDGVGVLAQGISENDGVYISKRSVPERTFAMVEDENGGVSISENFFYDSEVYQSKIYLFTDRPLYQPGDSVHVRAFGRNLKREGSKDVWSALPGESGILNILDSSGVSLFTQKIKWNGLEGGEGNFKLPDSAENGGYTLKLNFSGEVYTAAFRVARFTKPHFDVQILFEKPAYKVGEMVKGRVVLNYPSGQPVPNADIDLQLRSEQMSMFEGSYAYKGAMPVELTQKSFKSNSKGEFTFSFPAATKPSRYIATARATDQAAYRVTTKKELLIEGYIESYILTSDYNSTEPGNPIKIEFKRQGSEAADNSQKLKTWQAIRLEDRSTAFGAIDSVDRGFFTMSLEKPGHYMIRVVDVNGVTRGVRSHVVLGPGLKSATGQVEILADRESYEIGQTASLILTFPDKSDNALLTLERNDVANYGHLNNPKSWFHAKRTSEYQWKIEIPITENFAPNIIFSVAYSKNGEFGFQNKGLVVKKPMIDIVFKTDKQVYAPGEKVIVNVDTQLNGKPISALVAVGVVDEMIYVLQSEIAPPIGDFFHHQRRNQVRTTSSLSFYSFNPSVSDSVSESNPAANRDYKLLEERARRDARDTAYWNGRLKTDEQGKSTFEFIMPDALSRWRITGKAITINNEEATSVGQSVGFVISSKDYYMKWTGPTHFRAGDLPRPTIVTFNTKNKDAEAKIILTGASYNYSQKIIMKPGVTSVILDKVPTETQDIEAKLIIDNKTVDMLATKVDFISEQWQQTQSQMIPLDGKTPINLPVNANQIRMRFISESSYQFQRISDDLMEYPWGCVEQTSSRLIPMVMAVKSLEELSGQTITSFGLRDRIAAERRKLVSLAGPNAVFTWWGDSTSGSLLLSAHAYHADWRASKLLNIDIDKSNWEHLLEIYSKSSGTLTEKAYALWVLSYIGLPISEQAMALSKNYLASKTKIVNKLQPTSSSVVMDSDDNSLALFILGDLFLKNKLPLPAPLQKALEDGSKIIWTAPVVQAAMLTYKVRAKLPVNLVDESQKILDLVKYETPTIDRSLTLAFIEEALPQIVKIKSIAKEINLGADWRKETRAATPTYIWKNKLAPKNSIVLPNVPGTVAEIIYDSPQSPKSTLKIGIQRHLYKVNVEDETNNSEQLQVVEVKPGEVIDTRALYVDEVVVTPEFNKSQFLLLEVPLPPGADVDPTTWGLEFEGITPNFTQAKSSSSGLGYSVPIEYINEEKSYHQLIRFSSRGQFSLPPIRLFKMYHTSLQSIGAKDSMSEITIK
jgi:uncharacterized protein YfaS (alpha-2-macroglobulin family)